MGAVIGKEEVAVASIPGNEGRIAQAGVNLRWHACFLRFLLALGRLDPRNDALMKAVVIQGRTARHPWLIACDAHMCPDGFEKSLWFQSRHMFIKAAEEGVSSCRKKSPKGDLFERTYDHVVMARWLWWKILNLDHTRQFLSW